MNVGEPAGYFLVTGVAGLATTTVGVALGVWGDRFLAGRRARVAQREVLAAAHSSTSPLYAVRDWARAIEAAVEAGAAPYVSNAVGSPQALHSFARAPGVPPWLQNELHALAGHVARLHLLVDPWLQAAQAVPVAQAGEVVAEATFVGDVAHDLIEAVRSQVIGGM